MRTARVVLPPGSAGGNRTTALRWARALRRLGWGVAIEGGSRRSARAPHAAPDLLVALHARHARAAIAAYRKETPGGRLVVAATGTDLYVDLPGGGERAAAALEGFGAADRIVVLQEDAAQRLPPELRGRARVVHQSLAVEGPRPAPDPERFEAVLLAGLRAVKDPLLAARAARLAPAGSRLVVLHLGEALDEETARAARAEQRSNPRYRWLGPRPRREALCTLARARVALSTSREEGGSNGVSEAVALGVPVIATDAPGTVGLLGPDHPGLVPRGDAPALAAALLRAEAEPAFLEALAAAGRARAPLFAPEREQAAWAALLAELFGSQAPDGPG